MQLNVISAAAVNALIVVVYRNAQRNFCFVLTDDILIERFLQLLRLRELIHGYLRLGI